MKGEEAARADLRQDSHNKYPFTTGSGGPDEACSVQALNWSYILEILEI